MKNNTINRVDALPLCVALLGVWGLLAGLPTAANAQEDDRKPFEESKLHSALFNLKSAVHRGQVFRWQYGGGLSPLGDGFVLGTRLGLFYHFYWDDNDQLVINKLAHTAPFNPDLFKGSVPEAANTMWFRVADVLVVEEGERIRLFATHHYWHPDEQCTTARISVMEGSRAEILDAQQPAAWQTIFDAEPCLPVEQGAHGNPFAGNHIGGRMSLYKDNTFLVTMGDHQQDGWNKVPAMPMDRATAYGKTWRVSLDDYAAEIFTIGNRNAQGLWFDKATDRVWSTEHGAQGGDELNLLVKDGNYGWPATTYGAAYGRRDWPMTRPPAKGETFLPPAIAWVPSIGVSSLVGVRGSKEFPEWEGDLLVTSLRDFSIFRVRLREDEVAYIEQINLKTRIRDIAMGTDGRVVIWTDEGEIISLTRWPDEEKAAE